MLLCLKLATNVFSLSWGVLPTSAPISELIQNNISQDTHRFVEIVTLVAPIEKLLEASPVQALHTSLVREWVGHGEGRYHQCVTIVLNN